MKRTLYSPLNVDQCNAVLKMYVKSAWFKPEMIIGKVNGDRFWLQKTKKNTVNSFARYFHGRLIEQQQGTLIQGSFKIPLFSKCFAAVWLGVLFYGIGRYVILDSIFDVLLGKELDKFGLSSGILIMIIFGVIGLSGFTSGIWLRKQEEKDVIDFLLEKLEANERDQLNQSKNL